MSFVRCGLALGSDSAILDHVTASAPVARQRSLHKHTSSLRRSLCHYCLAIDAHNLVIVCFSIRTPARLLLYLSISLIRSRSHCRALERRRAGLSPARPTLLLSLISCYRTCPVIASANPINIRAPASLNSRQLRPRFPFLSRVRFSFLSFSARSVSTPFAVNRRYRARLRTRRRSRD